MSWRKLFTWHLSTVFMAASLSIAGQSALAAQEMRYFGWSDHVHETNPDAPHGVDPLSWTP